MFMRFTWLIALFSIAAGMSAQVKRLEETPGQKSNQELSVRAQAFIESTQPQVEQAQWSRVIYRELDLTKGGNASLYFPEEVMMDQTNLFRLIMEQLSTGKLKAFEYLDGREIFTPEYELQIKDLLDRFHILYEEKKSFMGKSTYAINPSDVPCHEVLSYYIIERWVFDRQGSMFFSTVEAICPILHRSGDFGGDVTKYPMFWLDYESLRPALTQHLIMSEGFNNTLRYTFDDFFALRQYEGDIYKTRNLRNQSLMQQYPHADSLKLAQERIENELKGFEDALWVPQVGSEKATAKQADQTAGDVVAQDEEEVVEKRSSRSVRSNPRSKSVFSRSAKEKEEKEEKTSSRERSAAPVRSVRRTR